MKRNGKRDSKKRGRKKQAVRDKEGVFKDVGNSDEQLHGSNGSQGELNYCNIEPGEIEPNEKQLEVKTDSYCEKCD